MRRLWAVHAFAWLGPLAPRVLPVAALAGFVLGGLLAISVMTHGILLRRCLVGIATSARSTAATIGLGPFRSVVVRSFLAGAIARVVAGAGL